ncbi:MAG: hypothetical protein M3179_07180 [Actinomycetota bacterium]|nr:hypothetical protein [Actinomycetota bacterium]
MSGPGTCPHGMTASSCLICQTLSPARRPESAESAGASPARRWRRWRTTGGGLAILVAGLAALLAVSWVAALVWSLLRVVELVLMGAVCGWIGWRLGMAHGRRQRR